MKHIVFSRFLCLGLIACLINCGLIFPVMAFPEESVLNNGTYCTNGDSQNTQQQKYLSDTEKTKLIEIAGKNKKFLELEATLTENGFTLLEMIAYELKNNDGRMGNQVLIKKYVSSTNKSKSLIFSINLDTDEVMILQLDLVNCAWCLAGLIASGAGILTGCLTPEGLLSLGAQCYISIITLARTLVCECAKCACSNDVNPIKAQWCTLAEGCP